MGLLSDEIIIFQIKCFRVSLNKYNNLKRWRYFKFKDTAGVKENTQVKNLILNLNDLTLRALLKSN